MIDRATQSTVANTIASAVRDRLHDMFNVSTMPFVSKTHAELGVVLICIRCRDKKRVSFSHNIVEDISNTKLMELVIDTCDEAAAYLASTCNEVSEIAVDQLARSVFADGADESSRSRSNEEYAERMSLAYAEVVDRIRKGKSTKVQSDEAKNGNLHTAGPRHDGNRASSTFSTMMANAYNPGDQ